MPSNLAMPMLDEWNGQPSGTEDGSQGHKVLILRFRVLVLSLLMSGHCRGLLREHQAMCWKLLADGLAGAGCEWQAGEAGYPGVCISARHRRAEASVRPGRPSKWRSNWQSQTNQHLIGQRRFAPSPVPSASSKKSRPD
jgi:hypothetical protein